MSDLNPRKLNVTFIADVTTTDLVLPRRYTLTHSDFTGDLFLTIGDDFDYKQISGLYTRLMRDEVLAEWWEGNPYTFRVYCHVSGGIVFGTARYRYNIFRYHMPMVLQAIRYGDRELFAQNPFLDEAEIFVHFHARQSRFNTNESWGTFAEYIV
ncbi:MAG: hypothetical protein GTO18_07510 [Anaerolineales bacterium]|nr:hypothetical protein [Anaerolineales bacterium]